MTRTVADLAELIESLKAKALDAAVSAAKGLGEYIPGTPEHERSRLIAELGGSVMDAKRSLPELRAMAAAKREIEAATKEKERLVEESLTKQGFADIPMDIAGPPAPGPRVPPTQRVYATGMKPGPKNPILAATPRDYSADPGSILPDIVTGLEGIKPRFDDMALRALAGYGLAGADAFGAPHVAELAQRKFDEATQRMDYERMTRPWLSDQISYGGAQALMTKPAEALAYANPALGALSLIPFGLSVFGQAYPEYRKKHGPLGALGLSLYEAGQETGTEMAAPLTMKGLNMLPKGAVGAGARWAAGTAADTLGEFASTDVFDPIGRWLAGEPQLTPEQREQARKDTAAQIIIQGLLGSTLSVPMARYAAGQSSTGGVLDTIKSPVSYPDQINWRQLPSLPAEAQAIRSMALPAGGLSTVGDTGTPPPSIPPSGQTDTSSGYTDTASGQTYWPEGLGVAPESNIPPAETALWGNNYRMAPPEIVKGREQGDKLIAERAGKRVIEGIETYIQNNPESGINFKGGKVSGFPQHVESASDIESEVQRAMEDVKRAPKEDILWYQTAGQEIAKYSHGNLALADKMARLTAKFAQTMGVRENTTSLAQALESIRNGEPITAGRYPNQMREELASLLSAPEVSMDSKGINRKLYSFYENIMDEVRLAMGQPEQHPERSTVDQHINSYFQRQKVTDVSPQEYAYSDMIMREATKRLNAEGLGEQIIGRPLRIKEIQSALWGRHKQHMADTGLGKSEGLDQGDQSWNYPEYLARATEVVQAETIPSLDVSPIGSNGLADQYNTEAVKILAPNGEDELAKQIGLQAYYQAPSTGGYGGAINPNIVTGILGGKISKRSGDTDPFHHFTHSGADLYADAWQYVHEQDAVPWFRADPSIDPLKLDSMAAAREKRQAKGLKTAGYKIPNYSLGYFVTFKDALTPETERAVFDALLEAIGPGAGYTKTSDNSIAIINYRGDNRQPFLMPDKDFEARLKTTAYPVPVGNTERFGAETRYEGHDWKTDPEGVQIEDRIRQAGFSDLLPWLRDRREQARALRAKYEPRQSSSFAIRASDVGGSDSTGGGIAGPLEAGQRGAVSGTGIHYSTERRDSLDSSAYGTGYRGAEYERVQSAEDQRLKHRIYFYVNDGRGIRPEAGVGGYAHQADLSNLYDATADALNLRVTHPEGNALESSILDAGFDGYTVQGKGVAVLLGERTIPVEYLGTGSYSEPAQFQRAEPSEYHKMQQAVVGSKFLPAGELTGKHWKRLAPAVVPGLDVSHLEDDKAYYRDQIVKRPSPAIFSIKESKPTKAVDVNSPEFKAWSGGSPVVSASKAMQYSFKTGEPVTVETYHGTNTEDDFTSFDLEKGGLMTGAESAEAGIWSTTNPAVADEYAGNIGMGRYLGLALGGAEKFKGDPTYDRLVDEAQSAREAYKMAMAKKNNADAEAILRYAKDKWDDETYRKWFASDKEVDAFVNFVRGSPELMGAVRKYAEESGIDMTMKAADADVAAAEAEMTRTDEAYGKYVIEQTMSGVPQRVMRAYVTLQNPMVYDAEGKTPAEFPLSERVREAKRAGHDGVIFRNLKDPTESATHVVAFKGTQIKSAISNTGEFSKTNPNIHAIMPSEGKRPLEILIERLKGNLAKQQPGSWRDVILNSIEVKEKTLRHEEVRGEGGRLIAPNGVTSNLDERQYRDARTPEFINFFGDWAAWANGADGGGVLSDHGKRVSKAVDKNGEPLLLYHGTMRGGYTTLDPGKSDAHRRPRVFMVDSKPVSASYAGHDLEIDLNQPTKGVIAKQIGNEWYVIEQGSNGTHAYNVYGDWVPIEEAESYPNKREAEYFIQTDLAEAMRKSGAMQTGVYTVFANIRNPLIVDFKGANWDGDNSSLFMVLDNDGKPVESKDGRIYLSYEESSALMDSSGYYNQVKAENTGQTTDSVADEAQLNGYDGVIIKNVVDNGGQGFGGVEAANVYIAFSANQIKSATQNVGTYSPESDDLRFIRESHPQMMSDDEAGGLSLNGPYRIKPTVTDTHLLGDDSYSMAGKSPIAQLEMRNNGLRDGIAGGPYRAVMESAFNDLVNAGLPRSWLDLVTYHLIDPELGAQMGLAFYHPSTGSVGVAEQVLRRALKQRPGEINAAAVNLRAYLSHELTHGIDNNGFGDDSFASNSAHALNPAWTPVGPASHAAQGKHKTGVLFNEAVDALYRQDEIGRLLNYPFAMVDEMIKTAAAKHDSFGIQRGLKIARVETFAQMGSMWVTNPDLVRRTMPSWARFFTLWEEGGRNGTIEQSRRALRKALRKIDSETGVGSAVGEENHGRGADSENRSLDRDGEGRPGVGELPATEGVGGGHDVRLGGKNEEVSGRYGKERTTTRTVGYPEDLVRRVRSVAL